MRYEAKIYQNFDNHGRFNILVKNELAFPKLKVQVQILVKVKTLLTSNFKMDHFLLCRPIFQCFFLNVIMHLY